LRAFVQPDVIVVVVCFLVLLDFDVPEALDTLLLAVVVAFMAGRVAVDLGYAKGEKREGKQFESVLGGGAVVDFGKEGVL
jgi:Flp pilus assembly protein TadB